MKKILSAAIAACAVVASPAQAVEYLFTVTGSYNATFAVSSTPRPDYALSNAAFVLYDVSGTYAGANESIADLTFYNTRQQGGFKVHDFAADVDLLTTHGVQLYTGTEAVPTFKLGVFALAPSAGLDRYTLTISNAVAAVPEPATWAMMIVGFGLVGVAMRRRSTTIAFA